MNTDRPIKEIMTTNLVTVSPDTNLNEINKIFAKNTFHHLPVVDSAGVLAGIISKEDLRKLDHLLSKNTGGKIYSEKQYNSLSAKDIMTQFPVSLEASDTIGLAADIFLANRFHALPVLDDDILIGLVTTHDLLRYSFNIHTSSEGFDVI